MKKTLKTDGPSDIEVGFDQVTAFDLFASCLEATKKARASQTFYEGLSPMEKEMLRGRVRKILEILIDRMDEWLPASVEEHGDMLTVSFRILNSEINETAKNTITEAEVRRLAGELREILQEEAHGSQNSQEEGD